MSPVAVTGEFQCVCVSGQGAGGQGEWYSPPIPDLTCLSIKHPPKMMCNEVVLRLLKKQKVVDY